MTYDQFPTHSNDRHGACLAFATQNTTESITAAGHGNLSLKDSREFSISKMIVTPRAIQVTRSVLNRNYGISAVLYAKASDPIQQLFVDKVREYASKSKGKKLAS